MADLHAPHRVARAVVSMPFLLSTGWLCFSACHSLLYIFDTEFLPPHTSFRLSLTYCVHLDVVFIDGLFSLRVIVVL